MLPNQLFIWQQSEVINVTNKFKNNYDVSRRCDTIFGVVGRSGTGQSRKFVSTAWGGMKLLRSSRYVDRV
jgi:hypothetical protein